MLSYHHFQVEIAKLYGVESACVLHQLRVMLDAQIALDINCIDEKYWIPIRKGGFEKIFPYIEKGKLKRVLYKLQELGLIQTGNFGLSKSDKTVWYSLPEVPITKNIEIEDVNTVPVESQVAPCSLSNDSGIKPAFGWSDIMPAAIEEVISKLIIQHGYDKTFYFNIWSAFTSKMDADDEKVPTMDFVRKRFFAYAQSTMMNFKQGNHRFNATAQRKEETKRNLVEKWKKYIGNPESRIINALDLRSLQTPVVEVWNAYINKNYEKDIPLKNLSQLEIGFRNFVSAWIRNEKPKMYSAPSKGQVNFDDTTWANDLKLGD